MAKRGPKPKTTRTRKTTADPLSWTCPAHLKGTAREEYLRFVELLRAKGTLDRATPRAVELVAVNYSLLRAAHAAIEKEGPTVKSDRGNLSEHPAIKILNAATIRLRGLLNDFGLTPASSKLSGAPPSEKRNGWEGLINIGS